MSGHLREPPEVKPRFSHNTCIDGHATTNARLITEDIRAMMRSGDILLNWREKLPRPQSLDSLCLDSNSPSKYRGMFLVGLVRRKAVQGRK